MTDMVRAGLEHLEAVAEIERICFPTNCWSMDSLHTFIKKDFAICLLAYEQDKPAGYALAMGITDQAEILKIAVLPEHRNKGLGENLTSTLIAQLKESEFATVYLECRASNKAALQLYRKTGFREVGRRKRYYADTGEDAILMRQDF